MAKAAQRLKWLTLSPSQHSLLPEQIQFTLKKPFFTASVVLSYTFGDPSSARDNDQIRAFAELSAKVPLLGQLHFTIDAGSLFFGEEDRFFAFRDSEERDRAKGNYRKILASNRKIQFEASGEDRVSEVQLTAAPPAPLLVHVLVLPAFQESLETSIDDYAAHLVNGKKFQALRITRVSENTFVGRTLTVASPVDEAAFLALPWANAKSFEFDFDTKRRTISAARIQLPVVGKIEIK
jgi:hypothetical protein